MKIFDFALTHWKWLALAAAIGLGAAYVHARDARIRAQGRAEVYIQMSDSLKAVADSLKFQQEFQDSIAADSINRLETIIAESQEAGVQMEDNTDDTLDQLRAMAPDSLLSHIDSLDIEITMERAEHEREVNALYAVIGQLETQISARDLRIEALERRLSVEVAARGAIEAQSPGVLEKAVWAVGGALVGAAVREIIDAYIEHSTNEDAAHPSVCGGC